MDQIQHETRYRDIPVRRRKIRVQRQKLSRGITYTDVEKEALREEDTQEARRDGSSEASEDVVVERRGRREAQDKGREVQERDVKECHGCTGA